MAKKTIVDKAGETVGIGIAMAADVTGAIKTALGGAVAAVSEVLKKEPAHEPEKTAIAKSAPRTAAKETPAKPTMGKSAGQTAAKKAAPKKAAKKQSARKVAKKAAPRKSVTKKTAKKSTKRRAG